MQFELSVTRQDQLAAFAREVIVQYMLIKSCLIGAVEFAARLQAMLMLYCAVKKQQPYNNI